MRLRIEHLELVGTTRSIEFSPGLNVIAGPITTGKTTLLRLCRMLLGAQVSNLTPEVQQNVAALSGRLRIGDNVYSVLRPLVSTDTAKVEIAGESEALRLPAMRPDATSASTYGRWLLERLGLPALEVPLAPTRLADSATSLVTINDYMLYCRLDQDEIDSSVFGSRDHWKNVKRKYVLEILYGLYDAEQAQIEESLREVQVALRQVRSGAAHFESFLEGTPWENRAEIERQLARTRSELALLERESVESAKSRASTPPRARELRTQLREIDKLLEEIRSSKAREESSAEGLDQLGSQLRAQSERLTRAIVSNSLLLDFDFKVCPRCCADVAPTRSQSDAVCYLCLQEPEGRITRLDLVREQDRLTSQILETQELADAHRKRARDLQHRATELESARSEAAHDLDVQLQSYVSDEADRIRDRARRLGELQKTVHQLSDYLRLYERLDAARMSEGDLVQRESEFQTLLQQKELDRGAADERLQSLNREFAHWVEAFGTPRFEGEPRAAVDPETYLPILNGRRFANLSSGGLKVLTNLAYALAHHTNALRLNIPLPGILLIDGISKNVGHDEYDWARVENVFDSLAAVSRQFGDRLQLIVAANDVPAAAEQFVRIRLTEDDRLVPSA